MDFYSAVDRSQAILAEHGRMSRRGLVRQFDGDEQLVDEVIDELLVRRTAEWEGDVLVARTRTAVAKVGRDEPELRHMTVLFCDLVGSTELSHQVDSEVWTDVIGGFLRRAAEAVESFDGLVGGYQGDGLIAYFGYPVAQEDAAERAVRAGLAIVAALAGHNERVRTLIGRDLQTRVGVHSGPIIIDRLGGTPQALGKTANVASRIEGVAPVNTVAISAATRRLVPGVFVLDDLGPHQLKGVSDPVDVSRVVRVGGASRRLTGSNLARSALVGRHPQLSQLLARWKAVTAGSGQMVEIVGEPGIGKSRLVDAFRDAIAEDAVTWLDAFCSPYAQSAPFAPVVGMQQRGLGFTDEMTREERYQRLEGALHNVGLVDPQTIRHLSELHRVAAHDAVTDDGGPAAPAEWRAEILAALVEWLLAVAREQPTVFVLEDVHWSDPSTLDLIALVCERFKSARVLVIVVCRSDADLKWPSQGNLCTITVDRIGREEIVMLATNAAGRPLPAEALDAIVERSDGVPLFVEELAVAMADSEGNSAVPTTLLDLLMARLEGQGPLRELAQMASVIGREFSPEDLALVAADVSELTQLLDAAVEQTVFLRRGFPALEYYFKHALLRDAVYDSMLARVRRGHHLRFARGMIQTWPERAAARPDLVAEHLTLAGEGASASEWWERAAEQAEATAAASEGEYFYRRAIEVADPSDVHRLVQLKLALIGMMHQSRSLMKDEELAAIWRSIQEPLLGPGFEWERAAAKSSEAFRRVGGGQFEKARRSIAEARSLAAGIEAEDVLLGCIADEASMLNFEGRPREVLALCDAAVSPDHRSTVRFDRIIGQNVLAAIHGYRSYSLALLGRFREAFSVNEFATRVATTSGGAATSTAAHLLTFRSTIPLLMDDPEMYLEISERFMATARRFGLRFYISVGRITTGTARAILEPTTEHLRVLDPVLDAHTGMGNLIAAPVMAWCMAGAYLAGGELDRAYRSIEVASDVAARTGQRWYDPQILARRLQIQDGLGCLPPDWPEEVERVRHFARERSLVVGNLHLAVTRAALAPDRVAAVALREAVDAMPPGEESAILVRAQTALASLAR